jgi:hypothetical protein
VSRPRKVATTCPRTKFPVTSWKVACNLGTAGSLDAPLSLCSSCHILENFRTAFPSNLQQLLPSSPSLSHVGSAITLPGMKSNKTGSHDSALHAIFFISVWGKIAAACVTFWKHSEHIGYASLVQGDQDKYSIRNTMAERMRTNIKRSCLDPK